MLKLFRKYLHARTDLMSAQAYALVAKARAKHSPLSYAVKCLVPLLAGVLQEGIQRESTEHREALRTEGKKEGLDVGRSEGYKTGVRAERAAILALVMSMMDKLGLPNESSELLASVKEAIIQRADYSERAAMDDVN